jgi:chemotaxis protein methyltransferase CheR
MRRDEARAASIPPAAVNRIGELVRARTRLSLRQKNLDTVARVAELRAAALGMRPSAYVERLLCGMDPAELEHYIAELTVGETHFFRGPPQFEALRRTIVPSLVERRARRRAISALSAGCATGEEAYSLAIVLREGAPSDDWQLAVTGVDLNARFLQKAQAARYSAWSLRDVPESVRKRYFQVEGDTFLLSEDLRRLVSFRRRSLTEGPLVEVGVRGLDLVVCQNVLYYLEPEVRPAVIASLVDTLAPGGFLLLGPVDHTGEVPGCRAVPMGETVIFERTGAASVPPPPPGQTRRPWSSPPPPPPARASLALPAPPRALAPPRAPEPPQPTLEGALALANAGELREALDLVEAVLEDAPEEARAHLLQGLLLVELGGLDAALDAFRRCVYLDASMLLAHAGAAVAGMRLGRPDLVDRHAGRLRALAGGKDPGAPIEGWEGMTVGRLLRLFESAHTAPRAPEVPLR